MTQTITTIINASYKSDFSLAYNFARLIAWAETFRVGCVNQAIFFLTLTKMVQLFPRQKPEKKKKRHFCQEKILSSRIQYPSCFKKKRIHFKQGSGSCQAS